MVEKPLATTIKDAERIAALARQFHVQVLTNYETTWYNSNQQIYTMVNDDHTIGTIRKMTEAMIQEIGYFAWVPFVAADAVQ